MNEQKELKCDDCGTTENVEETECPFADEIHDRRVDVNLCPSCYHERCMDI